MIRRAGTTVHVPNMEDRVINYFCICGVPEIYTLRMLHRLLCEISTNSFHYTSSAEHTLP
jgi:hypothetical protein